MSWILVFWRFRTFQHKTHICTHRDWRMLSKTLQYNNARQLLCPEPLFICSLRTSEAIPIKLFNFIDNLCVFTSSQRETFWKQTQNMSDYQKAGVKSHQLICICFWLAIYVVILVCCPLACAAVKSKHCNIRKMSKENHHSAEIDVRNIEWMSTKEPNGLRKWILWFLCFAGVICIEIGQMVKSAHCADSFIFVIFFYYYRSGRKIRFIRWGNRNVGKHFICNCT